jgi:MOSC domain-containing protein YiiM
LNDLVGQRFAIGSVTFEGIRLCEPCSHLAAITRGEVLTGLVHQAGLRAAIIESGTVRVGDAVITDARTVRTSGGTSDVVSGFSQTVRD